MNNDFQTYIGLGSNLEDPMIQIQRAITALSVLSRCRQLVCSPLYRSRAIGPGDQPDYINAVVALRTQLSPQQLLEELQAIENAQGRQRTIVWGPRTLDLDLLLYDKLRLDTPALTLPHPQMMGRNFVLCPLYDVAPDLVMVDGTPLATRLQALSTDGLEKLQSPMIQ